MSATPVSEHEVDARDRFDKWSDSITYKSLYTWLGFLQRNVLARIEWDKAGSLLDIACGGGLAVVESAHRLKEKDGFACGCDISQGMLRRELGDRTEVPNAHFAAATAQSLPYCDNTFDVAMCTAAFHHFPQPVEALREVRRVLRPGGTLYVADPYRDLSIGVWVWDRLHRWFEKGHVQYYRTDQMQAFMREAGFARVEFEELHPSYAETRKLIRRAGIFTAVEAG